MRSGRFAHGYIITLFYARRGEATLRCSRTLLLAALVAAVLWDPDVTGPKGAKTGSGSVT
jgi:hypothetical protein